MLQESRDNGDVVNGPAISWAMSSIFLVYWDYDGHFPLGEKGVALRRERLNTLDKIIKISPHLV